MSLIPEFEVGEKVILHARQFESEGCPLCGHMPMSVTLPYDDVVTIIGKSFVRWRRLKCGGSYIADPEGWWNVQGEKTPFVGVPYTLLEKIRS